MDRIKPKEFVITDETIIDTINVMLLKLLSDGFHLKVALANDDDVIVFKKTETLSDKQRKLYFEWVGIMAKNAGDSKDSMHEDLKSEFLSPIFRREDEEYNAMFLDAAKMWRGGFKKETEAIMRWIKRNTSVTKASTAQMKEYMDNIYYFASTELGLRLPTPDDNIPEYYAERISQEAGKG